MGDLCAWMTLATVNERVEKRRTSPDWWVVFVEEEAVVWEVVLVDVAVEEDLGSEDAPPVVVGARGELGEGTGDG